MKIKYPCILWFGRLIQFKNSFNYDNNFEYVLSKLDIINSFMFLIVIIVMAIV